MKLIDHCFPAQEEITDLYKMPDDRVSTGRYTFDVCYDIKKVLDKSSYPTSKKYKQKVEYYQKYLVSRRLSIKEIDFGEGIDKAWVLQKEWEEAKLKLDQENPNHFKEHCSIYGDCFCAVGGPIRHFGLFTESGDLLAFQILLVKKNWAHDDLWAYCLSSVNTRTSEYTDVAEVLLINLLTELDKEGVQYYNYGETGGDPGLTRYKEKIPSFRIYYGGLDFKKSTEQDVDRIVQFMQEVSTPENNFPVEYMPGSIKAGNITYVELDGQVIGMVECRELETERLMTNLMVSPEYRGRGIAERLLDQLPSPFEFFCYKTNKIACKFYDNLEEVTRLPKETEKYFYYRYEK